MRGDFYRTVVVRDMSTIYGFVSDDDLFDPSDATLATASTSASRTASMSSYRSRKRTGTNVRCLNIHEIDDHFEEAMEMFSDISEASTHEDEVQEKVPCPLPLNDASDEDWDYFFDNCSYEEFLTAPLEKYQEYEERLDGNLEDSSQCDLCDDEAFYCLSPLEDDLDIPESYYVVQKEQELRDKLAHLDNFDPHAGLEYELTTDYPPEQEILLRKKIEKKLAFTEVLREHLKGLSKEEVLKQSKVFKHKFEAMHADWELKSSSFQPHEGMEDSMDHWMDKLASLKERMSTYSEILSTKEVRKVVKHLEQLIFLFINLRETRSYTGVFSAVMAYVGTFFEDALFNTIWDYLADTLAMEAQSGDEKDNSDAPAWLSIFRSVTKNWKSVSKMPAWKYLQRILSLSVATGLCSASSVNPRIGEMKLFSLKIEEKQASATDLMDAILVTADYFVEAGYEAFKTRSIRPFYFDNQTARILDEAYVSISASMKALPTGDLAQTKYKTEAELAHVLENTLSGYIMLRHQTKNPSEKRTLDARCMQLEEWKLLFIQQTVAGGVREAPYSVFLTGKPGIGKTMMTQVLVEVVLQANGIKYTMKQVATVNPGDKFASTVKNDTIVIILDDFGNFVLEFENENPLKYIIEICNNVVSYVPKAEANEKGKVAWRPKMVVTTSNLDELLFNKLSNEPGSAKRRGIRMKPFLKSEYAEHGRFSEDKYRAKNNGNMPAVPDAYNIDIQEWGTKKWEFFPFKEKDTSQLSYAEALEFHIQKSKEHFRKQQDYVKNHGSIREQIIVCEHGCLQAACPKCLAMKEEDDYMSEESFSSEKFEKACCDALGMEPHFGFETISTWCWRWLVGRMFHYVSPFTQRFGEWARESNNETLQAVNEKLHFMSLFGFYDWLPDSVVESSWFENYLLVANSGAIVMRYWQLVLTFLFSFSLFFLGSYKGLLLNSFVWPYLIQCATKTHVEVLKEFRSRRGALPLEFTKSRDKFLKYALAGVFLLSGLAMAYRLYSSTKNFETMEPHGNLAPKSMKEIKERDKEQSVWTKVEVEALPSSDKSKCIDAETLKKKVQKNLVYVNYEDENGDVKYVNGFFSHSNEMYIPYHVLSSKPRKYKIFRRGEQIRGGQFSEMFSIDCAAVHPTMDLAMVQCCNTSPFEDLREYFALEPHKYTPFTMIFKGKDESFKFGHGVSRHDDIVSNSVRSWPGYVYEMKDLKTFPGMCMATMVSDTRAPQILGFHLGGHAGTGIGCAAPMTQDTIKQMHDMYFGLHVSALEHINEGTVFTEHYGIEYFESPQLHPKSPINWLPDQCNIRYFGSCTGRTSYYSEVTSTPIAKLVTDVCGHEQEYKGPHFHRWKSWYESLVHSSNPAIGCETGVLDWAVKDYTNQLKQILEVDGIIEEACKLTEIEIVSGKDGVRFLGPMPPNTSCGHPLGGPKRGKLVYLEPNETHNCPRTFCSGIWEEVRRFKACLRSGQRYYPLFKACLKDEPTKAEKEKVRVFQAAPLTLQIAIREYFLPIARILSLFPLVSECAVGINAMGPEWDQLQDHIKKFGTDRIVAGDYSKYDLRMSAKLTSAAFKILIDFAEMCGYSQEDLQMMRGIATEVVYPMMAYNGDLVMLQGSNPSGQNLTVYINSIVNSLLNRIGFRMLYPDFKGRFCDAVALSTYGDDFKSSASEDFPDFHHMTLAEKLAYIDMTITMPDKTSKPIPFLTDEFCDFLKRTNRYHEVGYYVGALSEESIFKSLKAVLRSRAVSLKEQSAMNIDGALREWFLHGREVYELRRQQMIKIAEESGITHMCTGLDVTFDDHVKEWKEKYAPLDLEDEPISESVDQFEPHSGTEQECDFVNCTTSNFWWETPAFMIIMGSFFLLTIIAHFGGFFYLKSLNFPPMMIRFWVIFFTPASVINDIKLFVVLPYWFMFLMCLTQDETWFTGKATPRRR